MILKLLKDEKMYELENRVEENLEVYLEGDISGLWDAEDEMQIKQEIDLDFENLSRELNPEPKGYHDAENAFLVYKALKGVTPMLARDPRLWVWLSHSGCAEFVRMRWVRNNDDDEKKIQSIRNHFFMKGKKSFHRDHAFSSLWWLAFYCKDYPGSSHLKTLHLLLDNTDIRSQLSERTTMCNDKKVRFALFDAIRKRSEKAGRNHPLFKDRSFRKWFKELNRYGGTRFLSVLDDRELETLIERLAEEAIVN